MHSTLLKLAPVLGLSLAAGVIAATPAQAASETLRPGDLDTAETRATGHVDFLRDGLHVYTEGSTTTDKAAGYFAHSDTLADLAAGADPSMTWWGTNQSQGSDCLRGAAPSVQLAFDKDNDGDWDGYLVGEKVYGDKWWGTGNLPSDPARPTNPGGGGYPANGTLDEWSAAFPTGQIIAGGFSLGSGCYGDGVIDSITIGDTTYRFASDPETTEADVTGDFSATRDGRKVFIAMKSDELAPNTTVGEKLRWVVKVDDRVVARFTQGPDERDVWKRTFTKNTGARNVTLLKNGEQVYSKNVWTRKHR